MKFHITPEGPRPCRATFRDCPVEGVHTDADLRGSDLRDLSGQFVTKPASESGVDLSAWTDRPGSLVRLDEALERYGLDADDVPGLADAWQERFGVLDRPRPDDVASVMTRVLGDPHWGRVRGPHLMAPDVAAPQGWRAVTDPDRLDGEDLHAVVTVSRGDGEYEMYDRLRQHPQYVRNDQVEYGGAQFVFKVPDEVLDALPGALLNREAAQGWDDADAEARSFAKPDNPPWQALAAQGDVDAVGDQLRNARRGQMPDWQRSRLTETLNKQQVLSAAVEGKGVPAEHTDLVAEVPAADGGFGRDYGAQSLAKLSKDRQEAHERQARLAVLRTEIESGAVSPALREHLIGELPEKTYQSVEGTGRRKRTVTKTYRPTTDFRQQEADAERDVARYDKEYREVSQALSDSVESATALLDAARAADEKVAELEEKSWSLGWQESWGQVPARPELDHYPW